MLLVMASVTPASAADIREPTHGVTLTYQDGLWSAAIEDQNIHLTCKSDICGGASGECETMLAMTRPGLTSREFFNVYQQEFTSGLVDELDKLGVDPVVIDPPTTFWEGGAVVSLSSIRYDESGTPTRTWAAAQEAPFGVLTLTCYADEAKYDTAHTAWLALINNITIPKR
ncbi:hypothetical protein [Mesorhizobium loti]|uniref:hypothetical protein n=1 Tax=Rhizobium loti TaxID=381 RepID=UPI0012684008|nr:hypothetical protein [Mesorhizobium loti]